MNSYFNHNGMELTVKDEDGLAYVVNKEGQLVVFPTREELVEVVMKYHKLVSGSDAQEDWLNQIMSDLEKLTDEFTVEHLAKVAFLNTGLEDVPEEESDYIIDELDTLVKNWISYCITYGLYKDSLVLDCLEDITISTEEFNIRSLNDAVYLNKDADDGYCCFTFNNLIYNEIDLRTLLYKLSTDEINQTISENNEEVLLKGIVAMIEDIECKCKEYFNDKDAKDIVEYNGIAMRLKRYDYEGGGFYFERLDNELTMVFDNQMDLFEKYIEVCSRYDSKLQETLKSMDRLTELVGDKNKAIVQALGIDSYIDGDISAELFEQIREELGDFYRIANNLFGQMVLRKIRFEDYGKRLIDKICYETELDAYDEDIIYVTNKASEHFYSDISELDAFKVDLDNVIYMLNEADREEAKTELKRYNSGIFDIYDCKFILKAVGLAIEACREWLANNEQ